MSKPLIVNQPKPGTAEILLYGTIGKEITADAFVKELKALSQLNETIFIRINSGGGSIFEGMAIYNAIKTCKSETIGYIDGLCASMATVIAISCNKLYMSKNAMFMTHKAKANAEGNANDMRNTAQLMDSLEEAMSVIYSSKTGLTPDKAKDKYMNSSDRWITADVALTENLIDGIYDSEKVTTAPTSLTNEFEVINFYNAALNYDPSNNYDMLKLNLSAEMLGKIGLSSNPETAATIETVITNQVNKIDSLTTQLANANTAKVEAEKKLNDYLAAESSKEVDQILNQALNTDKKITAEMRTQLAADYAGRPADLKKLIESMPKFQPLAAANGDGDDRLKTLTAMTWEDLDKKGHLVELKALSLDTFKAKYKDKFGTEYGK